MPGLSQYRHFAQDPTGHVYPGPNEDGTYNENPVDTGEWEGYMSQADIDASNEKFQQDTGFASMARGGLEQMLHGMYRNVPKEYLDAPMLIETDYGAEKLTPRQIMDILQKLSPNNELQAP